MSGRRILGVETEYAVTALDAQGSTLARGELTNRLLQLARKRLSHLPDCHDHGLFLANGSRLYIDAGDHPEISSPECLNPWDIVRYAKAGDLIMEQLAAAARAADPRIANVMVFKGNVDYSGSGSSWGAHESYCHRADVDRLHRRLIPHLVSRVIYTGAGGFNPFSRGLEFMLSPRAAQITHVVSSESTSQRNIIHTRDESLAARGYRRQHLICGESLRSDLATWLKVGVTALVVAMIEGGVPCGDDVALAAPLDALRTFSHDVGGDGTAVMAKSQPLTAIQIQRRYLGHALAHVDDAFMPGWAGIVCERWRETLAHLERGPDAVASRLDWAIKWKVYRERARRRGIEWTTLPAWTHIVETLERARLEAGDPVGQLSTASLLAGRGPLREAAAGLSQFLGGHRLRWDDLDGFLTLRQELFEVDTRFGQVGANTLFSALEESGVLTHRVERADRVVEAIDEPPAEGRARVRGEVIRRAARAGNRLACTWNVIWDPTTNARVDLSDPFTECEVWEQIPSPTSGSSDESGDLLWGNLDLMLSRFRRRGTA